MQVESCLKFAGGDGGASEGFGWFYPKNCMKDTSSWVSVIFCSVLGIGWVQPAGYPPRPGGPQGTGFFSFWDHPLRQGQPVQGSNGAENIKFKRSHFLDVLGGWMLIQVWQKSLPPPPKPLLPKCGHFLPIFPVEFSFSALGRDVFSL